MLCCVLCCSVSCYVELCLCWRACVVSLLFVCVVLRFIGVVVCVVVVGGVVLCRVELCCVVVCVVSC